MGDDTDVWVLLSEVVDGGIDVLADDEGSGDAVGGELGEVEVVEVVRFQLETSYAWCYCHTLIASNQELRSISSG